jgi:putative addiction module CopG family antidote
MAFALAKENEAFIVRMLRLGRFNNQSEVVREALRRMEREETSYLNPESLTAEEAARIYAPNPEEDARELAMARGALRSLRNARRKK